MRSTSFPAAGDVLALGDDISDDPEAKIRKCGSQPLQHCLNYRWTFTSAMQWVLHDDMGICQFVNNVRVVVFSPNSLKPFADYVFVHHESVPFHSFPNWSTAVDARATESNLVQCDLQRTPFIAL